MGWICRWRRAELGRLVAAGEPVRSGSRLARHLARCEACARARRDLEDLTQALRRSDPAPSLSTEFRERLEDRLRREGLELRRASARAAALRDTSLVACATLALLCALFGRSLVHSRPSDDRSLTARNLPRAYPALPTKPVLSKHGPDLHMADGRGASAVSPRPAPRPERFAGAHRRPHLSAPLLARRTERRTDWRVEPPALRLRADLPPMDDPAPGDGPDEAVAVSWSDAGTLYQGCGDYSRASEAYGLAFSYTRNADLAVEASENANRAGDLPGALIYCALALHQ